MKLKKLNARGFSHDILVILFVMIFAIAGVAYLVASHADSPTSPATPAVTLQEVVAQDAAINSAIPSSTIIPASTIVTQYGVNAMINAGYRYAQDITTGQNVWFGPTAGNAYQYSQGQRFYVGVGHGTPQYSLWPDGYPGLGSTVTLQADVIENEALRNATVFQNSVILSSRIVTQFGVDQMIAKKYVYAQIASTGQNVWIYSQSPVNKSNPKFTLWPEGYPGLGSTVSLQTEIAENNAVTGAVAQAKANSPTEAVIPSSTIVTQAGVNALLNGGYRFAQGINTGENVWIGPNQNAYQYSQGQRFYLGVGASPQYALWPVVGTAPSGYPGLGSTVTLQAAVAEQKAIYDATVNPSSNGVIPASTIVTQDGVNALINAGYRYAQDINTGENVWISQNQNAYQYSQGQRFYLGVGASPQYALWPDGYPDQGIVVN